MTSVTRTITPMPDYGGAFGWVHHCDTLAGDRGVGLNCWCIHSWGDDETRFSDDLRVAVETWQDRFEGIDFERSVSEPPFDWDAFHAEGLALAHRLRAALGPDVRLIYEKPYEDPDCDVDGRREVLPDGSLRPLPPRVAPSLAEIWREGGPSDRA